MKKYMYIVVSAIFVTCIMSGCREKETHYGWGQPSVALKFEKDTVNLMITPESDEYRIGFGTSNDTVPNQPTALVYVTNSTVKIGTQVNITDYNEKLEDIVARYDDGGRSGSIKLKVYPNEIAEPLHMTFESNGLPKSSVTINLIPTL